MGSQKDRLPPPSLSVRPTVTVVTDVVGLSPFLALQVGVPVSVYETPTLSRSSNPLDLRTPFGTGRSTVCPPVRSFLFPYSLAVGLHTGAPLDKRWTDHLYDKCTGVGGYYPVHVPPV